METVITRSDLDRMKTDLVRCVQNLPTRKSKKTITELAQSVRTVTSGPRQGKYDPHYTPYGIEIQDNLSPSSPIQRTVFMKPVQIGGTFIIDNVLGFYMREYPADCMYISGTKELLKNMVDSRFELVIDEFGIRESIGVLSETKNSKKTGDTTYAKYYQGCSLHMISAQSASSLRSLPKMVLMRDEVDAAPPSLTTGEGNFLEVSKGRVQAFGARQKIFDTSTPTTEDSLIYAEWSRGDCREYNVPCPHCGAMQALEFGDETTEYGLKGKIENGKVVECYYLCRHCGSEIEEHYKPWMMALKNGALWVPTKESESEYLRSYSMNSLYAPPGMTTWAMLFLMWNDAKDDPEKMKSFTNLYMGRPYIDEGEKVEVDEILKNMSGYRSFEIPENVLFLTAGVDVQEGSAIDKKNPPRIEMEIIGHGRQYRTWSIAYEKFYGSTKDPYKGAWDKLYKFCVETGLVFTGKNGAKYPLQCGLIDSGHGRWVDVVYRFCQRVKNFYPSKGTRDLKKKTGEKFLSDLRSNADKVKYRRSLVGADNVLILVATVAYKDTLYYRLGIKREDGEIQKPGFCEFPSDYKRSFFDMLTSETRNEEDGSYSNHGRRNEALDCRVYGMCAADVFIDYNVDLMRKALVKQGKCSIEKARNSVRTPLFLAYLEKQINDQIRKLGRQN